MVSKWFISGLGIKRWLFLLCVCTIVLGLLIGRAIHNDLSLIHYLLIGFFFVLTIYSLIKIICFVEKITKIAESGHLEDFFNKVKSSNVNFPLIVTVGGGTGLSTMLRGIKNYNELSKNITAIVTVSDDGGSSGKLREDMHILPPGDIRNCLTALSTNEPLLSKLFQYRFKNNTIFSGHSFGNLFIAALTDVTGDFLTAIKESSKILSVSGKVLPSTTSLLTLRAIYNDGSIVEGESKISTYIPGKKISRIEILPSDVKALPEAILEIKKANVIIIGPGSLYTSLIPNLLINEIKNEIVNSKAIKIYVCNVMTQPGETDGYSASDHLKVILSTLGINKINYMIVSTTSNLSSELLLKYKAKNAEIVNLDEEEVKKYCDHIIKDDLISQGDFLRHDPDKLAKCILNIIKSENLI